MRTRLRPRRPAAAPPVLARHLVASSHRRPSLPLGDSLFPLQRKYLEKAGVVDALTKVRINGSAMLYFGTPRRYYCWDTIAQWSLFPPTAAPLGGGGGGLELRFSRPGDAHIDCTLVNVSVSARCNSSAPSEPKLARLTGAQDGCDWAFDVETSNAAVCAPGRAAQGTPLSQAHSGAKMT